MRSLRNALHRLGCTVVDVRCAADITNASTLLFPGVGRFGQAMAALEAGGYTAALRAYVEADRPFFGICLGMQVLFRSSEETPGVEGLGLIPGDVTRFPSDERLKVRAKYC